MRQIFSGKRQTFSDKRQIFFPGHQSSMGMKLAILAEREISQKRSTIPLFLAVTSNARLRRKDYKKKTRDTLGNNIRPILPVSRRPKCCADFSPPII